MKILSVVATRPNFIKIAPFIRAIEAERRRGTVLEHVLVHTDQHYDNNMSAAFFAEFDLPEPDYHLNIGSGSHAFQDGNTMLAFESVLVAEKPDWVVVVGDVNATMACCITAKKMQIRVCHIEAGIRSGDRTMPEEINRILTDSIADLLLTPDELSLENLKREGRNSNEMAFVGNIMIDTLDFIVQHKKLPEISGILSQKSLDKSGLSSFDSSLPIVFITLHRPSNVDSQEKLGKFIDWLASKSESQLLFIWTMHPRTMRNIAQFGFENRLKQIQNLVLLEALSYTETLAINQQARCILTDSGGLQEEACVLGTPFLVLREQTERPATLVSEGGTGIIAGNIGNELDTLFEATLTQKRRPHRPPLWDGKTAERCLTQLLKPNL